MLKLFNIQEKLFNIYKLEEVPDFKTKKVKLYNNIGCCLRKLGKFHDAEEYLEKAIKMGDCRSGLSFLNLCIIL
jgi:Tfp pilus assembly protein PilF